MKTQQMGYTQLHEACTNSQLVCARCLLEFGADVNAGTQDGTRYLCIQL